MISTLSHPPKHYRTHSYIERERAREWDLRSLEAELEAQASWRQGVAESLQRRLDEQIAENQRLRAENAALKAKKRDDDVETTWEMRSLQAELDSQAAWAQSVADTLQRRLDDKSAECDSLRAENAALKAATRDDAASQEWKMRSLEAELDAQAQWRQRVARTSSADSTRRHASATSSEPNSRHRHGDDFRTARARPELRTRRTAKSPLDQCNFSSPHM